MRFGTLIKKNHGKIKVGSNKGSAFFYIGDTEDLIAHIEGYEAMVWQHNNDRQKRAKDSYYRTMDNFPTPLSYIRQNPHGDAEGMLTTINAWFDDYRRRKRIYEDWVSKMREYVSLMNRQVISTQDATGYDEGYKIIIVEGKEHGSWWTADEATEPMSFSVIKEDG